MRHWLVLACLVAALSLVAAAATSPAGAAPARASAPAKSCHKGYTLAAFSWGQRCVRAGQFCKKVRNPEYHKYGFQCVNGQLRKQTGKRK